MRRLLALASIVLLCGCASGVAKVAASENAYDFVIDRFDVVCHVPAPPAPCVAQVKSLNQWEHDLGLSAKAIKNGGKFPRQLAALKADEKAAVKK